MDCFLNSPTVLGDQRSVLFSHCERTYLPRSHAHRAHVTQEMETNLLTHMFALCLRADEWATDTTALAGDLSMPVAKVNQLFKSLGTFVGRFSTVCKSQSLSPYHPFSGCKIEKLTKKELDRRRLPESEANTKRAHLMVPLEFPKTRAKRRN